MALTTGKANISGNPELTVVDGIVTGLKVNVQYAILDGQQVVAWTSAGVDAWAAMTGEEKAVVQSLYDRLRAAALASYGA